MSLFQVCNEHIGKYSWPTLQVQKTPEGETQRSIATQVLPLGTLLVVVDCSSIEIAGTMLTMSTAVWESPKGHASAVPLSAAGCWILYTEVLNSDIYLHTLGLFPPCRLASVASIVAAPKNEWLQ